MTEAGQTHIRAEEAVTLNRAEWIAAGALVISAVQGLYMAGVEVQRLNDHDRRILSIETNQITSNGKIEELRIMTARIDANVSTLADQAKERREGGK